MPGAVLTTHCVVVEHLAFIMLNGERLMICAVSFETLNRKAGMEWMWESKHMIVAVAPQPKSEVWWSLPSSLPGLASAPCLRLGLIHRPFLSPAAPSPLGHCSHHPRLYKLADGSSTLEVPAPRPPCWSWGDWWCQGRAEPTVPAASGSDPG